MNSQESSEVTLQEWIQRLKEGDPQSHDQIWKHYFQKMVVLARRKLTGDRVREFDEEDVAISAFNSFFRAVKDQRLPQLDDELDLWKVLVVITLRKIAAQRRRMRATKRGGGKVRGESIFVNADGDLGGGLDQAPAQPPQVELLAEVTETYDRMMAMLPDPSLRKIAKMKMDGFTNREIGDQCGCVERTVQRKLDLIRANWSSLADPVT